MENQPNQSNRTVTIAIVTGLIALLFGLCAGAAVGGIGGFIMGRQAALRATGGFNRSSPFQPNPELPAVPQLPGQGGQTAGGVLVQGIVPGSPAMLAGIQPGDVIVRLDNTTLGTNTRLSDLIAAHKPGDRVGITVQRNGAERTFNVTLGALPTDNQRAYLGIRYTQTGSATPSATPNP